LKTPEKEGLLRSIVDCLQLARRIYFAPVVHYLLPLLQAPEQGRVLTQLQRGFHTVVSYSLPWSKISPLLGVELAQDALIILGIDTLLGESGETGEDENEDESGEDKMEVDPQYSVSYEDWKNETSETRAHLMTEGENEQVTMARDRLLAFLNGLQQVGLGGDKAQKVFASVMNIMMTDFVRAAYTGQWETPSSVPQHLRHWIENVYARLAVQILAIIHTPHTGSQPPSSLDVSFGDVEKWQEIGIARLGALRTSELFDVIVDWPASTGAVEDLRHFTTHPAARAHVTQSFITILNQRLLHPGASTVEILQLYISIIRAFHLLDPKGVLLDRIARPIRRYLRDRDDTIKVIVSGLLAEPTAAGAKIPTYANDTLVELSTELSKAHQLSLQNNTSELDWDDMNWMPDPVDAAPDYRKSKSSDVIDSLVSLFDSKETFVKELQTLLSDRLLQKRKNYDQEISVLELLKVRFGDSALQACEVMLHDISDSRKVDKSICKEQGLNKPPARHVKRPPKPPAPELHSKILSRFFWPTLQDQEFKIPDEIVSLQRKYAAGFEALKASRKLTWRNGLGQVLVELQLGDREFSEEVTTWQATVIHAFHSDHDEDATRTISNLSEQLEMTPALVRSACLFWVSKRILTESSRDEYSVLEYLPSEDEDEFGVSGADSGEADLQSGDLSNAAAAAEAAAAVAAKEAAEAAAMEKMNLYWQFIVGMLTNQGAMPLQRIVMMLKIVVPGGFPFSNEELREFLAGMVAKGKLEIVSGGNYKIVP
jgi:anaphase-promoting complex subunit 2